MRRRIFTRVRRHQLLISDADRRVIHRPSPRDVERILDGDVDAHLAIIGEEAVESAVTALNRRSVDRRALVRNAALAGTTGIVSFSLPRAAVASSVGGAPTGEGFSTSATFTETDANGGTIGFITPGDYVGSTIQVVAEGAAGGSDVNGAHAGGRGRRVGLNLDRAALVSLVAANFSSSLSVVSNSGEGGTTATGGGGIGGQAVAVLVGSTVVVVAGGGGGAGLSSRGGDADAAGEAFTNAGGGTLTGGQPPSNGTGGASGVAAGSWFSTSTGVSGLSSPTSGTPIRGGFDNKGNGSGGAGYGGGGTGGAAQDQYDGASYPIRATGGGGGGSYVNPTYRVGSATLGYSTRSVTQRCSLTVYFNS